MHALVPAAAGRGIFIWLLFRSIAHAVGWPITLAIFVVIAVAAMLARQRRSS
jgi:hypothetical protein